MIIEVRPTSALRRHRARIAGALLGATMIAATLLSVSELAYSAQPGPQHAPYSDPVQR